MSMDESSSESTSPCVVLFEHEDLSNSTDQNEPSQPQTACSEGYWWHVNKGGFPIPEHTWDKMWDHVIDVHPNGECLAIDIRNKPQRKVAVPTPPSLSSVSPVVHSLLDVQSYMNELEYNHTGTQFFDIRKSGPISRLMESAKEIIRESLPIKCLEAVILALYLTSPLTSVQRFAIGFKSKFKKLYYRHVVLGVHWNGNYGAIGMSRRKTLMYKPLTYTSLADLMKDYLDSYKEVGHTVVKVKLSPPIPQDTTSHASIQWKFFSHVMKGITEDEQRKLFERFSRTMRSM